VELNSHDQRFMTQTPAIPTSELRPGLHALGTRCLDQGSLLTLLGFSLAADLYPLAVELGSPIESGAMHGAGDGPNISDLRATPATQFRVSPLSRLWQHSEFKPLASIFRIDSHRQCTLAPRGKPWTATISRQPREMGRCTGPEITHFIL
jgi:hypothetical protein